MVRLFSSLCKVAGTKIRLFYSIIKGCQIVARIYTIYVHLLLVFYLRYAGKFLFELFNMKPHVLLIGAFTLKHRI